MAKLIDATILNSFFPQLSEQAAFVNDVFEGYQSGDMSKIAEDLKKLKTAIAKKNVTYSFGNESKGKSDAAAEVKESIKKMVMALDPLSHLDDNTMKPEDIIKFIEPFKQFKCPWNEPLTKHINSIGSWLEKFVVAQGLAEVLKSPVIQDWFANPAESSPISPSSIDEALEHGDFSALDIGANPSHEELKDMLGQISNITKDVDIEDDERAAMKYYMSRFPNYVLEGYRTTQQDQFLVGLQKTAKQNAYIREVFGTNFSNLGQFITANEGLDKYAGALGKLREILAHCADIPQKVDNSHLESVLDTGLRHATEAFDKAIKSFIASTEGQDVCKVTGSERIDEGYLMWLMLNFLSTNQAQLSDTISVVPKEAYNTIIKLTTNMNGAKKGSYVTYKKDADLARFDNGAENIDFYFKDFCKKKLAMDQREREGHSDSNS